MVLKRLPRRELDQGTLELKNVAKVEKPAKKCDAKASGAAEAAKKSAEDSDA